MTQDPDSDLVLADFGIAKTLDSGEDTLWTMAGSFGYAAPEVMEQKGHGKPVDMWSLGVITYTLLCGYLPYRSENLKDLLRECTSSQVVFHERYWKDVSEDAKNFITRLIVPDPEKRWTSQVSAAAPFSIAALTLDLAASTGAHMAHGQECQHGTRLGTRAPQGQGHP